jgi:hypothetical protein
VETYRWPAIRIRTLLSAKFHERLLAMENSNSTCMYRNQAHYCTSSILTYSTYLSNSKALNSFTILNEMIIKFPDKVSHFTRLPLNQTHTPIFLRFSPSIFVLLLNCSRFYYNDCNAQILLLQLVCDFLIRVEISSGFLENRHSVEIPS